MSFLSSKKSLAEVISILKRNHEQMSSPLLKKSEADRIPIPHHRVGATAAANRKPPDRDQVTDLAANTT